MAIVAPQPTPWSPTSSREIADGAGNIVQYTIANVGTICLVVNAHQRLSAALGSAIAWLETPADQRGSESDLLNLLKEATGKIGVDKLASAIELGSIKGAEANRAIASELDMPEANFIGELQSAIQLIPNGASYSVSAADGQTLVTVSIGDKSVSGKCVDMSTAIVVASLRARSTVG